MNYYIFSMDEQNTAYYSNDTPLAICFDSSDSVNTWIMYR